MSQTTSQIDSGTILRRSLFLLVLVTLTLGNLMVLFRGLNSPQAMDQAQIAREISRGQGFTTKMIRPAAYNQVAEVQKRSVPFVGFPDTYHSPLNPLINAAALKLISVVSPAKMVMTEGQLVYPLDRIIAMVCTLFFLMAIGVNYLLISRIFDAKIAGVCAILMLFCETFWGYSLSGLPQMLMLLLFSCGIYFVYRAVEDTAEGELAMVPALVAGLFFTLLALTHWLAVWIALGYIIYAAVAFRPRGVVGISVLFLILVAGGITAFRNFNLTDNPLGAAYFTLYNGLGAASETLIMRTLNARNEALPLDGLVGDVLRTTLLQATNIIPLLGGILVAPVFFIALFHPFRRAAIANFRWAILLMWVSSAFGLAFFGISQDPLDPNQLHLLFAPIMAAYGLAFISILWSRLESVTSFPMLRNVHLIVIVFICAFPLVISLPKSVRLGMEFTAKGGFPHWPPYYAPSLDSEKIGLRAIITSKQIAFSDQPWATAWYADRLSIWLPRTRKELEKLEGHAADSETPVSGILISPVSHGQKTIDEAVAEYGELSPFVMDGQVISMTGTPLLERAPKVESIFRHYQNRIPLLGSEMIFYSDRAIKASKPSTP